MGGPSGAGSDEGLQPLNRSQPLHSWPMRQPDFVSWIRTMRVIYSRYLQATYRCYLFSVADAAGGAYLACSACHLFTSSGLSVAV